MHTSTHIRPPIAKRDTGVVNFPGGYAWRPRDHRAGFFVVCKSDLPLLTLAVCDDHGALQAVPSYALFGGGTVKPAAYFPEGTH